MDGDRGHTFQCRRFFTEFFRIHPAQFVQAVFCAFCLVGCDPPPLPKHDALFKRLKFILGKTKDLDFEVSGEGLGAAFIRQDIVGDNEDQETVQLQGIQKLPQENRFHPLGFSIRIHLLIVGWIQVQQAEGLVGKPDLLQSISPQHVVQPGSCLGGTFMAEFYAASDCVCRCQPGKGHPFAAAGIEQTCTGLVRDFCFE